MPLLSCVPLLALSGFPPGRTVRATFTAHGSSMETLECWCIHESCNRFTDRNATLLHALSLLRQCCAMVADVAASSGPAAELCPCHIAPPVVLCDLDMHLRSQHLTLALPLKTQLLRGNSSSKFILVVPLCTTRTMCCACRSFCSAVWSASALESC
jgi:hypothetical protein